MDDDVEILRAAAGSTPSRPRRRGCAPSPPSRRRRRRPCSRHGVEHRLLQQLAHAARGVGAGLGAHEDRDGGLGMVGEQTLQHGLPDETRCSGEKDVRATEIGRGSLRCHGISLAETVGATDASPGSAASSRRDARRPRRARPAVPNTIVLEEACGRRRERSTAPIGQTACLISRRVSLLRAGRGGEATLGLFGEERMWRSLIAMIRSTTECSPLGELAEAAVGGLRDPLVGEPGGDVGGDDLRPVEVGRGWRARPGRGARRAPCTMRARGRRPSRRSAGRRRSPRARRRGRRRSRTSRTPRW